jgi:two-component system autoinducer 1 sensor kinase/phosphatase LuxN
VIRKERGEEMLQTEIVREKGSHPIPASGRKREVLVVDDYQAVRQVLSEALSFWGYGVTLAANGIEAGKLFLTGSYDLVITDLEMPLMNGWELSQLVKERSPNTPVMVVSGDWDEMYWEKTNMRCVDAIVLKPFKLEAIKGTVRRLLSSGT